MMNKPIPGPAIRCPFALAALCVLVACGESELAGGEGTNPDVFTVRRDDLRISVREQGEIKALRETRIRSEVEGQATIIYLVPEGTRVQKGDRLVELDASSLEDRAANQAITVERARAALVNAEQNVEILGKELQAEEAAARSKLEIARINLEKHLGGRSMTNDSSGKAAEGRNRDMIDRLATLVEDTNYTGLTAATRKLVGEENLDRDMGNLAQQILDQIDAIRLAAAELKLREDTLEHSKRLAAKDYITRNELDRHRLDYESQASRVKLAWNELDLLINYGLRAEKIDLELKVDNSQLELDKVLASATARRARENAELGSKQSEYDLAKERLDNLRAQIDNAVILAPAPGLVVYAKVGDGRRQEIVEEGMNVRERQSLIILPDVSTMVAELKVAGADVDKVVRGQTAIIEVGAFPDEGFVGRVTRVSPLPDSGSRWSNNNKKVYKTEVTLDGENTLLRPGMSSTVEIVVGTIRDVLFVPLQAVRRDGLVHYVWRENPAGGIAAQRVEVGRTNLSHVEVTDGLAEGDRVLLTPPSDQIPPEFEQPADPESQQADAEEPAEDDGDDTAEPDAGEAGERPARRRPTPGDGSGNGNGEAWRERAEAWKKRQGGGADGGR